MRELGRNGFSCDHLGLEAGALTTVEVNDFQGVFLEAVVRECGRACSVHRCEAAFGNRLSDVSRRSLVRRNVRDERGFVVVVVQRVH